jgi:hypothetical protein
LWTADGSDFSTGLLVSHTLLHDISSKTKRQLKAGAIFANELLVAPDLVGQDISLNPRST